jgi:hypothetical protein
MQNNTHHETTEIGSCISVAEKLKSVSHQSRDVKSTRKEVEIHGFQNYQRMAETARRDIANGPSQLKRQRR